MASVFQNAVKFVGSTLKQAATPDVLRDYKHASKIFVGGGSYRLSPKNSFLFHVFIDLNETLASGALNFSRTSEIELGLMAKTADLPKYNYDIKTFNAYNRINLVQSKIKYEDLSITFHDDSANVIRNFYYDYYRYYFRDSDYGNSKNLSSYNLDHKYNENTIGNFGYTRRKESAEQFIKCIRIYSLHQKRFSEYILVNPLIKSFRHGQHINSNDPSTMEHTMVVTYETVIYNDGLVSDQIDPMGFATLQYHDLTPSPLKQVGGVKSIFGAGGLLDAAGSVLGDINNGQVGLGTILNAARAINTARGMNLKNALVSEVTTMVNSAATNAIIGALPSIDQSIRSSVNPTNQNGIHVPSLGTVDGAVSGRSGGIQDLSSVATLAGAAILLNSTPIVNKYQSNPVTQSTVAKPPSNYNPSFPSVAGANAVQPTGSDLYIANDAKKLSQPTNQGNINNEYKIIELDRNITGLNNLISVLSSDAAQAQTQVTNTQNVVSNLTTRLAAAEALTPPMVPPAGFNLIQWTNDKNLLVATLKQDIQNTNSLYQIAVTTYNNKVQEINRNKQVLNQYLTEKNNLVK